MSTGEIISVIGVSLVGLGLIWTWVHNSRGEAGYLGSLGTKLEGVEKRLDDEHTGLGAIKESVDKQVTYCARVSSGFEERIKGLETKK